MSAEDVEVVRSVHPGSEVDVASLLTDDEASRRWMAEVASFFDPSIRGTIRWPGMGRVTFFGLDVWRRWLEGWVSFCVDIEDLIDGGECVVVVNRGHGWRQPDVREETLERTVIWTVRNGRIVEVDFNVPHAEALAAVGLTT